jgi:hypothetical protein
MIGSRLSGTVGLSRALTIRGCGWVTATTVAAWETFGSEDPDQRNPASWFGRSTTLESKVPVVCHVAYLLFLCGWYRRALAGSHFLASGLVRPRIDTHCFRSPSSVSPLNMAVSGCRGVLSSSSPAERMVGDASVEGVHRWAVGCRS